MQQFFPKYKAKLVLVLFTLEDVQNFFDSTLPPERELLAQVLSSEIRCDREVPGGSS